MWTFLGKNHSSAMEAKQDALKKQIIRLFLQEGEKTIPEVCKHARLSIPTGTKIIDDLIKQAYLVETGKRDSPGGRRPAMFDLNPNQGYVIGVEILLRSLRVSIVNLRHEVIYEYETTDFDISQRDETYAFLAALIPSIIKDQKIPREHVLGVGIGITGRVNSKKGISYSYLFFDAPLAKMLKTAWALPVYIANDTHLMTLGEQRFGTARGRSNVIYVNISRGLGIGIISNGHIHSGHSGFAGEFGHILADENGKQCVCGKKGCLGGIVGGHALESAYQEMLPAPDGKQSPGYKILLQMARNGDTPTRELLSRMGEQLGKSLAILIDILNPEMIIIGGRFASVAELMRYSIIRGISLHSLPQLAAECDIQVSLLGEKAAMLGAFALVFDRILK